MKEPRVFQGTWRELAVHASTLGDKQLTLIVPGDEEPQSEPRPRRPEVVKTKERLEELLLQGLASPGREMTDADWEERIARAESRVKGKKK